MPRKVQYKDVYIPQNWVPLLKEALHDPVIQRKLLLRKWPNTPQGVVKLLIQVYHPAVTTWDENNGEYMVLGGLLGGFVACALTAIFFTAAITRRRKDVAYR